MVTNNFENSLNSSLNSEESINQQFTQFVDKYFSFSKALAVRALLHK